MFVGLLVLIIIIFFFFKGVRVENYNEISLTKFKDKINTNDDFILYIHSPTCEACQKFLPKLKSAIKKSDTKVFALDVNDKQNMDQDFYTENDIRLTPTIIKYISGKEVSRKTGKIKEKEIHKFLMD